MGTGAAESRNIIVLIVEDEFLVREDIASFLVAAGCIVLQADSGEAAIAICDSDAAIDVVFTDVHLNGSASGWEVAEAFRAARPNIPVLYTSGNTVDRGRCVSGSSFLNKPYRPHEVLTTCHRLCGSD
jgi:CheY-like chemotaxis protein